MFVFVCVCVCVLQHAFECLILQMGVVVCVCVCVCLCVCVCVLLAHSFPCIVCLIFSIFFRSFPPQLPHPHGLVTTLLSPPYFTPFTRLLTIITLLVSLLYSSLYFYSLYLLCVLYSPPYFTCLEGEQTESREKLYCHCFCQRKSRISRRTSRRVARIIQRTLASGYDPLHRRVCVCAHTHTHTRLNTHTHTHSCVLHGSRDLEERMPNMFISFLSVCLSKHSLIL